MENNGVDAVVKLNPVVLKKLMGSLSAALWTGTCRKGTETICWGKERLGLFGSVGQWIELFGVGQFIGLFESVGQ